MSGAAVAYIRFIVHSSLGRLVKSPTRLLCSCVLSSLQHSASAGKVSAMEWTVYLAHVNNWNVAQGPKLVHQGMAGPTVEGDGIESKGVHHSGRCGRHAVEAASFPGLYKGCLRNACRVSGTLRDNWPVHVKAWGGFQVWRTQTCSLVGCVRGPLGFLMLWPLGALNPTTHMHGCGGGFGQQPLTSPLIRSNSLHEDLPSIEQMN
jgi:hypothetical protein